MATVVISVGGSIILQDLESTEFLTKLAGLLRELSKNHKIYIVVGGGKTSRDYIKLTRKLGTDEASLDEIGIESGRLEMQNVSPPMCKKYDELIDQVIERIKNLGRSPLKSGGGSGDSS